MILDAAIVDTTMVAATMSLRHDPLRCPPLSQLNLLSYPQLLMRFTHTFNLPSEGSHTSLVPFDRINTSNINTRLKTDLPQHKQNP
jgi:hypothetical protein